MTAHKKDKPAEPEPECSDPTAALHHAVTTIGRAVSRVIHHLRAHTDFQHDAPIAAELYHHDVQVQEAIAALHKTTGDPT